MDGSGHYTDPFLIRTQQDLSDIRLNTSAHYKLINDIDLIGDWVPIPTFSGVLDGTGHTVSGIRYTVLTDFSGFFTTSSGNPVVENIVMETSSEGVTTPASYYKGLLFGSIANNSTVTVRRAGFFGHINTGGDRAGGLIGYISMYGKTIMQNVIIGVGFSGSSSRIGAIVGYTEAGPNSSGILVDVYYNSLLRSASSGGGTLPSKSGTYTDISSADLSSKLDFVNTWEVSGDQARLRKTRSEWQGGGYIAGTDAGILTVKGVPAVRNIHLLDAGTMLLLKSIKSLPNGHYIFKGLDPNREYIVMARDDLREFEPFAWDYVKPADDLTLAEQDALEQSWQAN